MNNKKLYEDNLKAFKSAFNYFFSDDFIFEDSVFFIKGSLTFNCEVETTTKILYPSHQIARINAFSVKTRVYPDDVENLITYLKKDIVNKTLPVYFAIKDTVDEDYDSYLNFSYELFLNDEHLNIVNVANVIYNITCSDFSIKIKYLMKHKLFKIELIDHNSNFENIEILFNKEDDLSDLFSFILKKFTNNCQVYEIEDNITSEEVYEFLKLNYTDIMSLQSLINY